MTSRLVVGVWMFAVVQAAAAQERLVPLEVLGQGPVSANTDQALTIQAVQARSQIENSVSNFLVPLNGYSPTNQQQHLGMPVASTGDDRLHIAYDLSGKGLVAQWNLIQTTVEGQRFDYQAQVGETGAVRFVINTRI